MKQEIKYSELSDQGKKDFRYFYIRMVVKLIVGFIQLGLSVTFVIMLIYLFFKHLP